MVAPSRIQIPPKDTWPVNYLLLWPFLRQFQDLIFWYLFQQDSVSQLQVGFLTPGVYRSEWNESNGKHQLTGINSYNKYQQKIVAPT